MSSHTTKVVVAGPTGHRAVCDRCGWTLDCIDAQTAARECWAHVRHSRPVEEAS